MTNIQRIHKSLTRVLRDCDTATDLLEDVGLGDEAQMMDEASEPILELAEKLEALMEQ